jgi:hypothetical protein
MSKQTDLINVTDGIKVDSSGNVGIGTDSPSATLDVASTAPELRLTDLTDDGYSRIRYDGAAMFIEVDDGNTVAGSNFRIQVDGTEAMRITADSVMLVGTTGQLGATETSATGHDKRPDGTGVQVRDGNTLQYFNRLTSDGDIIDFRKDGVNVGSIGTLGGVMHLGSGDTFLRFQPSDDSVRPSTASGANRDNAIDLGDTSARFDDVYATNGTIQTSDATEKQDIASLTATEMLVGKRLSALFKTFRWKDSVASNPNARTHTGTIAQDVQAAFTAEGLDAGDYSLFISTTWFVDAEGNEVEEGTEGAVSKTRMGIRYSELLAFVGAYNEQRFASIEARLTVLEAV